LGISLPSGRFRHDRVCLRIPIFTYDSFFVEMLSGIVGDQSVHRDVTGYFIGGPTNWTNINNPSRVRELVLPHSPRI
jgi:hypothetical protein